MDQEEAPPPPYSAVDPLLAPSSNGNNSSQSTVPLRGNISRISPEVGSSSSAASAASPVVPTHFVSAATYFEQRPATRLIESREVLDHHMTIYPRSQTKDFPRRPRCWATRRNDVAQQDWDTFLRYLFPPQLGLAAASDHLPRQLRAEIRRDRKDRPQETDEERRARIAAVVDEWNQCFFELRGTRIAFIYVEESDNAPASALCPRCYPAATKANQGTCFAATAGEGRSQNAPQPVPGQTTPLTNMAWPASSYDAAWTDAIQGAAPWGPWNGWSYAQPQNGNNGSGKGGSLGWLSDLTSKAQKYGERFAEQAEQYGNQLSQHAMHYGRQVEEQALAHGRWIEEQTRFGRKQPAYQGYPPAGYPAYPNWSPTSTPIYNTTTGVVSNPATPTNNSTPVNQPTPQPSIQSDTLPKSDAKPPLEQTRRASISSTSSESSLSSIDSLSTTSDLNTTAYYTTQPSTSATNSTLSKNHVGKPVPLDAATGFPALVPQQNQSTSQNDWGRWESPEQQQRASTERRAMKEEMRATRKAFRDIVKRAREEQRARRRVKRSRRHHAPVDKKIKTSGQEQLALDGSLKELSLDESSKPIAKPQPQRQPVRSEASSEFNRSNLHTPSSSQASVRESGPQVEQSDKKKSGTPSRIKDILKPRGKKRDEDKNKDGT
ncbi:uncharacterized protein N7469_006906 [Penicillium citrinum]|uniref:Uncharacterized protein n=1 Tax=Penicillium citrinum TaxID=5077 RepID=A0A9W9NVK3_PENCI|nr:uncharacterized protein N7469_006906 [Penicillium citrinum]KAJ5226900.1 hypothetical protein N7469_006906 [Penicillium citrinum]